MRLLVVTARFPTADRPSAGVFVRDRLRDPDLEAQVIAPAGYDGSGWIRYARLAWSALTARGPFDGVETHFVLPSGLVGLLVARARGLPLVVYAHGSDVRNLSHRSRLWRALATRVVRGAAAVATNSAPTATDVREMGPVAAVIPPGVDLDRFTPSPRPARGRVLYVGGDVASKGVDVARQLATTLVGPGLMEVDPDDMPGLLATHDVLLMPSTEEGFGLAAAEATAAGRWVVAAAVGGLIDTVIDGVTGTLVRDGDYAAALKSVPDYDPEQVAAHGARFDVARHRASMANLWTEVLRRRSR